MSLKDLLPKDQLIQFLERNPPEFFTALSNSMEAGSAKLAADNAAKDVKTLIKEIEKMTSKQCSKVLASTKSYLDQL